MQNFTHIDKAATRTAELIAWLCGHPLSRRLQTTTWWDSFRDKNDFIEVSNPKSGEYWFKIDSHGDDLKGAFGKDGCYIRLYDARTVDGNAKHDFSNLVPIGEEEVSFASRDEFPNPSDTDREDEIKYTLTKERSASENVGSALTQGFKFTAGGDAAGFAVETDTQITASWEREVGSSEEASREITHKILIPPHSKKVISFVNKKSRAEQHISLEGKVDFDIEVHAYWWFTLKLNSISQFIELFEGKGRDYWDVWSRNVHPSRAFRSDPIDPEDGSIKNLKNGIGIKFDKVIEVDSSENGAIGESVTFPL